MSILLRTKLLSKSVLRSFADFSAESILTSDNLMRAVSKFEALPFIRLQTTPSTRKAAVLVPLCEVNEKVSLLYTLRTSGLRSHKGQVSFPGGMQDSKDKTLKDTALRETKEEIGIGEKFIKIWGQGHPIVARGETSVVPIIGTIDLCVDLKNLTPNPQEVEQVFTVPIEDLCKSDNVRFTQFKSGYSTPCYFAGDKRIWGLTAIITHTFLTCLFPTNAYNYKIKFIPPVRSAPNRNITSK